MKLAKEWLLTPYRAAIHVPTATAVVTDLHLGYDAVRRHHGEAVPEFGWDAVEERLEMMIQRHRLEWLVVAGDLVEAAPGHAIATRLLASVACRGIEIGLVPGNHDRGLTALAGVHYFPRGIPLGDWLVLHDREPARARNQVTGHVHPVLRVPGMRASVPCYLWREGHLVLPALSDDAAGLNVLHADCWKAYDCCGIMDGEVVAVGPLSGLRRRLRQRAGL